ncbi:hypothetical protein [Rhizobium lentis]|uniref:hypothetical protein n=1 Tax=Rhizobium lentis TaxID=1138194 RepID=UPI002180AAA9|nr:hypothetical protein [Rhizobium lentis]
MAKNDFLSWDTTAAANTDIGGIGILGSNAVNNFDDAFRTLMAQLRRDIDNGVVYAVKAGSYTALATDNNAVHRFTATATLSLTAAATLATDWHYTVIADGGDVTIDPNGAETIDGATTLVVPSGSAAHIICNGTSFYTQKTIAPLQPFATVASAATTDIGAATSQNVTITGTTTITSFGTVAAGTFRRLRFSGILTLTHNGTSLILPNASNILTAAGDTLEAISLGSGNWVVTSYERASTRIFVSNPATTSGTSIDVDIPVGATRIMVYLIGVSTNGTSIPIIQLGTASSFENTNYIGSVGEASALNFSSGFALVRAMSAAAVLEGGFDFDLAISGSNTWGAKGSVGRSDSAQPTQNAAGRKALSGALTRIRLTTAGGTDTFDAGSISVWVSF